MSKILIFFRHDHFELWSIDANNRLIPLDYLESNIVPLYFLISGADVSLGSFAKEQFEKGIGESLGHFWTEVVLSEEKIIRGTSSLPRKDLLSTALFELIFPEISRNYFSSRTVESIVKNETIILCFEPFCNEEKSNLIFTSLKRKFYNSDKIVQIDYWNLLFTIYTTKGILNSQERFLVLGSYNSDLHCFIIENNKQKDHHMLEGKGIDPRLNAVSDFCIEKIKARGSLVDQNEIRSYIKNDVLIILNSLNKGLVEHVFDNPRIGVARFIFSIHKSVLESRLENPSDLLLLESEIKSFKEKNNCRSKIILLTEAINLPVFYNRFENIGTIREPENFNLELLQYIMMNVTLLANKTVDNYNSNTTSDVSASVTETDIVTIPVKPPLGHPNIPTGITKAPLAPPGPPKPPTQSPKVNAPSGPPKAPSGPPKLSAPPGPPKAPAAPPKAPPGLPKESK